MSAVRMKPNGEIALPRAVRKRYGFTSKTPIRIINTRSGILLIPLTDSPMTEELRKELAEWQELARASWARFPYEDRA